MQTKWFFIFLLTFLISKPVNCSRRNDVAEDHGVLYPTQCEVCKYLTVELQARLEETGKSRDIIETGYSLEDRKKNKKPYAASELRLLESLEGICDKILDYNIHKERKDSSRFSKGQSETFRTLHGLVDKGVKVDLGIPYELWDKPSVEITTMKSQCESLLEKHEDDIENWYFHHQEEKLVDYLCKNRVMWKGDAGCLLDDNKENEEKSKPKKNNANEKNKLEL